MPKAGEPLVSVVVPTCGRPTLLRALRSLQEQTWDRWECHVVNDAPEQLAAVRSAVAALADERIEVVANRVTLGPSSSRNAGIEAGGGPLVAFLDDDDVWLPRKLEWHVEEHERCPDGCVVYSDLVMAWEEDLLAPFLVRLGRAPDQPFAEMLDGRFMAATMSSVSAHRSCLQSVGGFDPELWLGEDQDMMLRLAQRYPVRHLPEPALIYVLHLGASLSSDAEGQLVALETLSRRWGVPQLEQRRWVRDRVALHAMLAGDRERGLRGRLAALAALGRVARPPSYGRLRWLLDGALMRPRALLRLSVLALGGARLFRWLQELRGPDPVARELVGGRLAPGPVPGVGPLPGTSAQPGELRSGVRARSRARAR